MKKLLMILLVEVFITACSSNAPVEDTTKNGDGQSVENAEKEDEQVDDDDTLEKETNDDVENDTEVYGGA